MSESNEREWLPLELIKTSADFLVKKGVPTPRLDAEVLLCSVLGCSRVKLYTIFDTPLTAEELSKYREMIRRRIAREPVSRILGKREFMGLDFMVTPAVLSPRPDTEILVEKAIQLLDTTPKIKRSEKLYKEWDRKNIELLKAQIAESKGVGVPQELLDAISEYENSGLAESDSVSGAEGSRVKRVLDLGTGSGCIPISLVKHVRDVRAVGVDISSEALAVAAENAQKLGAEEYVDFVQSDFFEALDPSSKFDIIVSNPPYLVKGDKDIWPEVAGYDPEVALYAADHGLACYKIIIRQVKDYLLPNGYLLLELGSGQLGAVSGLVADIYPEAVIACLPDHAGIERVLVVSNIVAK